MLFFSDENTYTIASEKCCKNINELTADIKYSGKWITGDTVFRGKHLVYAN